MTDAPRRASFRTMRRFDAKFGADFLAQVPREPGVYRFFDAEGEVVYVGKAKDLRRRLAQYQKPRGRRGKKPRLVVRDAVSLQWETHATELDASVAEVRLIQALRPRHNVVSTFDYLYPYIGAREAGHWRLCFTTRPELFPEYTFSGAFRSREVTALGFFSLIRLLRFVAHLEPKSRLGPEAARDEHTTVVAFRQVPARCPTLWTEFFRGARPDALGDLAVRLLEKPSARARAAEVEGDLAALREFFETEARPLHDAVAVTGYTAWPVPQKDRDPLFLRYRGASSAP